MAKLVWSACILYGLQLVDHGFQYVQLKQEIKISDSFGKDLKARALEHGFRLDPQCMKEDGFYKIISDAFYDISNLVSIVTNNFVLLAVVIFKAMGAMAGLFLLDFRLALFILSLIPVKIWINRYMKRRTETCASDLMDANKDYNTWFSDLLTGAIDVKLWNLEKKKTGEAKAQIEGINAASRRLSLQNAKHSLITGIVESGYMNIVYLPGGLLICRRKTMGAECFRRRKSTP